MKRGTRIGDYEILGPLGSGGMGAVYRARDHSLDRDVAIKVLAPEIAADPSALARFEREAKLLAAINHPNIATIHGIEKTPDGPCLVMEIVEGETLAERLQTGRVPVLDAMRACAEIARGMEAAHARGIVHRDLKPANVALLPDGRVKLLDFGIAKWLPGVRHGLVDANAPTAAPSPELTASGVVVGTVPYMSPEQVRGLEVDERTDTWALGCILYETLTGERAFAGATLADTLSDVLEREPDWKRLPTNTPSAVRGLLRRCLHKDSRDRLHSMADVRIELVEALAASPSAEETVRAPANDRQGRKWWYAGGVVLIAVLLVVLYTQVQPSQNLTETVVAPARISPFLAGEALERNPAWNPIGSQVVYVSNEAGNDDVWICDAAGSNRLNLTKDHAGVDDFPAWSPDGQRIAFYSERDGPGIYTMTNLGGGVRKVAPVSSGVLYTFSLNWSASGDLIYTDFDVDGMKQVYRASDVAERTACLTCELGVAEGQAGDLSASAELLAFKSSETGPRGTLLLADLRSRTLHTVAEGIDQPRWHPGDDRILFISARDGLPDLWELPVDRQDAVPSGPARRITSGLGLTGSFAIDATGSRLLVTRTATSANLWSFPTSHTIPDLGVGEMLTSGGFADARPRWMPGSDSIVFESNRRGDFDIWRLTRGAGTPVRLTSSVAREFRPRPSPDGAWIALEATTARGDHLHLMRPDGSELHPLDPSHLEEYSGTCCSDWSPDGAKLVFGVRRATGMVTGIAAMDGNSGIATEVRLHDLPGSNEQYHRWSPDGRFIAYEANREGSWNIWVVGADGGHPRQVTAGGGNNRSAAWSTDPLTLWFIQNGQSIWRMPMSESGTPAGAAELWLEVRGRTQINHDGIDIRDETALLSLLTLASDIWLVEFPQERP